MGPLRLALALSLALLLIPWSTARASTFSFGPAVLRSDLSVNVSTGDPEDQNSTQYALSTAAIANFRAQASADALTSPAIADVQYVWDLPYTVTRNVSISACCPGAAEATVPIQGVYLGITFSGAVGVDEFGGDEAAEIFAGISVVSLGARLSAVSLAGGARSNSDGVTPVTGSGVTGFLTTVNFQDGLDAGEVSVLLPSDYRAWQDQLPPAAIDYSLPQTLVQSFTDTLRVSFRVRAVSRPSGSVSTTAGESIACAGLQSGLDDFDLVPNCGSGLTLSGAVGEFGAETLLVSVPEPGTLALCATALGAIGFWRRRARERAAGLGGNS